MKKIANIFLSCILIVLSLLTACNNNGVDSTVTISNGLEYELNADEKSYTVTGFGTWKGTNLVIPSEYNNLPVTAIGEAAFYNDYYLLPIGGWEDLEYRYNSVPITSVIIPDSVTTIGSYAFMDCSLLSKVTMPNSLQIIGEYAFLGCTSLTNITIPNSVQAIGELAFAVCKSLNEIYIPASLTSIKFGAFLGCISLTKINVDENNPNYTSISNNLYSKDTKTLIQYALGQNNKAFTIPQHVEKIEYNAFSFCNYLRELTLPSTMTKIEEGAFSYCASLSTINIPNTIESIEDSAFTSCYSLTSITIPESVTYISDTAFIGCYSLVEVCNKSSVELKANCHVITDEADSYLKNVNDFIFYDDGTSVSLIKYIGDETEITLPEYGDSIPYAIADYAFYDIARNYNKPVLFQTMAGSNSKITSVTIPNYVVSIGAYAFNGCTSLESITIPNSVTHISEGAFMGCTSLTIYCEATSKMPNWHDSWNARWDAYPFYQDYWMRYITTIWDYTNK